MLRVVILTAFALLGSLITATTVFTQSEETIVATVTGQSVALTVSPDTIDYGTVPFEQSRSSLAAPGGAVTFVVENTGNVNEDFLVNGTDAIGSGLLWALIETPFVCQPSNYDKFRHSVTASGLTSKFLTTNPDFLVTDVAPAGSTSFTSEIYMPCFGSSGAGGEQASTNIVLTATEAAP